MASGEERFEAVEGVLALGAPMEDRVLLGQGMLWVGDSCEILDIAAVVVGKTQEGADFCGILGRADLPDGGEQRGIW